MQTCNFCQNIDPKFTSVEACLRAVADDFKGRQALYRGEACSYPKTCSGMRRLIEDEKLSFVTKSFLMDASMMFMEWFDDELGIVDQDQGDMFLQHYGLPTDLLDVTSSAKIATYFAYKDQPGHVGWIGVFDVQQAQEHLEIFKLEDFKMPDGNELIRPRLQEAYAVRHRPGHYSDFKDEACCKAVGLRWYSFKKSLEDINYFGGMDAILDASNDPCAEMMKQWLATVTESSWQDKADYGPMLEKILLGL